MALTANDGRRNAAAENDPALLTGPDVIHYAELLIRFYDHPVLSPHYQFWGNLADYLNRAMHIPDRTRHSPRDWTEFNDATAMAAGYIEMSQAPAEQKLELLQRYFRPEPEPKQDGASTAEWFAECKSLGCTGTGFDADHDTIEHRNDLPCPVHPGL